MNDRAAPEHHPMGHLQGPSTYLAVRTSKVPLSLSSLSFSKYMSLDWRRTNQRFFQFLRDSVEEPPPFLCSQPCLRASCLERNHRKVSSLRTHQRRFQEFIKPPVPRGRGGRGLRSQSRCGTLSPEGLQVQPVLFTLSHPGPSPRYPSTKYGACWLVFRGWRGDATQAWFDYTAVLSLPDLQSSSYSAEKSWGSPDRNTNPEPTL